MNRFPLETCLETRWELAARLFGAVATTPGRIPGPRLCNAARQTRRLHHQPRNHPAWTLAVRPACYRKPLTQEPNNHRQYSTPPPAPNSNEPTIHSMFERHTSTWQYLVADPSTHTAVIIDPVLDYNNTNRTVSTHTADALLSLIHSQGYAISHILETHAHADHLSAAFYLQRKLSPHKHQGSGKPPLVGIGKRIGQVQRLFGKRYGVASEEHDGVFDLLLEDDAVLEVGRLRGQVMHLPGHTPDHVGYRIGDNVFCGDSLFHPSLGTARCDFPGGSAQALYHSARKLLSLPDHVKIWTGHDYPVQGEREPEPWTSVGEHRARNKHLRDGVTEDEFVELRSERDRHLAAPRLVHESLQVNIRAGQLPKPDEAGMRTFKLPLKVQGGAW
ncbi:beta-lactamase-like protein [Chaetomidium leptoderma]|uniref:Beta-lactamase-like protein n=1 Tax=Chaetomidium leptoderma TaxID=669021 RepID=A0AAN6ZRI5_9PEZI|nr:beta-lactamase-like protein [Chaetomidium leptoderma]